MKKYSLFINNMTISNTMMQLICNTINSEISDMNDRG